MSFDRLFPFIGYLTAFGVWYVFHRVRLERKFRRRRALYEASTRPEELEKRLDALIAVAAGVLNPDVLRTPEIDDPTLGAAADQERLEEVIELCASRYDLDRGAIFASYARLPAGVAADVRGERQLGARFGRNDQLVLERAKLPSRWRVRVANTVRESDARLLVAVAHELAHVALQSHGVKYDDPQTSEILTEAVAVLAGFGPVMQAVAYQEERDYVFAVRMRAGVRRMGYLHARSIEHLRRRRAELGRAVP